MAKLRIVFNGRQVGARLRARAKRRAGEVTKALRSVADEAATEIEDLGRADIGGAGNFGTRWTEGFQAKVSRGGGSTVIRVTEAVPYWRVFQFGAVIHGKPLLWIPLSFAADAQGVRARDYPQPLFRVNRKSGAAPLLMTGSGGKAEPKYFGKEFVTIPKKFHLIEIVRGVAKTLGARYRAIRRGT